jgi:DNA repair exonuclease SbcCD ATPase subunit
MDEQGLGELDDPLVAAKEALRRKQKLARMLDNAEQSLEQHRAKLRTLAERLAREEGDVERLEGKGLVGLFHTILGDRESQLEKERQEYLAAKLQHDAADVAVATLEEEVADLRQQVTEMGDPEGLYESLLAQKEQAILEAGDERAERLLALSEEWASARSDIRELEEALQAGQQVLEGLQEVRSRLRSAESWGVWDLIGGGLIATSVKHARMDEARRLIHRVQQELERFGRELADVDVTGVAGLEADAFVTFADYVFDGLIIDWVMQARIQRSLEAVRETQDRVSGVVEGLRRALPEAQAEAQRIERELREAIEGA